MLSLKPPTVYQTSKCYVTFGVMGHLDPKQPPSKGKPWTSFAGQGFVHRADLIVPEESFEAVRTALVQNSPAPEFKRVVMSLQDVLSKDFYTEYIRKGDIMMLSEGRIGVDNVYSLKGGILTLFLDREAYERAGLVGKPHGVKGKRGLKPRWIVELDLKADSMYHGKKGFDRLVYASKKALASPVTWLFCNVSGETPLPDPMLQFSPTKKEALPKLSPVIETLRPPIRPAAESLLPSGTEDFESFATELYEWLSLIRLGSPRIHPNDNIDPFLSRYKVPSAEGQANVRKISWQGFLSPAWSRKTLIDIISALPEKSWFVFSTTTFPKGVTE
ncbi:ribonuclease P protein subunit p40 [Echria macrotheca]|uniref:Ribonuclease P protein subunit p40 n=1 Tax=Echria macrotheca TaxID=438768 RepID=A0AAJ0FBY9_9PEZI|nr:ribonuclease P protein subunit p40 [Echria macrotheca]